MGLFRILTYIRIHIRIGYFNRTDINYFHIYNGGVIHILESISIFILKIIYFKNIIFNLIVNGNYFKIIV